MCDQKIPEEEMYDSLPVGQDVFEPDLGQDLPDLD